MLQLEVYKVSQHTFKKFTDGMGSGCCCSIVRPQLIFNQALVRFDMLFWLPRTTARARDVFL